MLDLIDVTSFIDSFDWELRKLVVKELLLLLFEIVLSFLTSILLYIETKLSSMIIVKSLWQLTFDLSLSFYNDRLSIIAKSL